MGAPRPLFVLARSAASGSSKSPGNTLCEGTVDRHDVFTGGEGAEVRLELEEVD